jgi:protease-4
MTGFEQALLQQYIESGYDNFIGRVAEGRGMSKEEVDEIGQGRVWSAENAMNIGLVDLYGGVNDAVKLAAEKAGLERYRTVQLPKVKDPFEEWLKDFSDDARSWMLKNELGEEYKIYRELKELTQVRGVLARLPYTIQID